MRIDVVGRHMDVTDPIREHAETKADKLLRHYDRVQQVTYTLDTAAKNEFAVELVVDVERHNEFVSKATGEDLYNTIDQATQKAARQLTDFKEKLQEHNRG